MAEGILAEASARLAAAGSLTPRLDAELLLASALNCDRSSLITRPPDTIPPRFEQLLDRRAAHEPVAYILGWREFRRIRLQVDGRVLIPRPETELLVEVGLSLPDGSRVADVGTGSGAVALALKDERPALEVFGTDVSSGAIEVARQNAQRLSLDVHFVLGDLLAGIECEAVLANLPYVALGDPLPPDVSLYEPAEALFAGSDGLEVIRRLVSALGGEVGLVAFEIAPGQSDWLAGRLDGDGWSVDVLRDLAGLERVVVGRR